MNLSFFLNFFFNLFGAESFLSLSNSTNIGSFASSTIHNKFLPPDFFTAWQAANKSPFASKSKSCKVLQNFLAVIFLLSHLRVAMNYQLYRILKFFVFGALAVYRKRLTVLLTWPAQILCGVFINQL